jgi:hypothetical protein
MISRAKLGEDELLVLWKLGRKLANQKFKLTGHPRLKLASTFQLLPANSVKNSPELLQCNRGIVANER